MCYAMHADWCYLVGAKNADDNMNRTCNTCMTLLRFFSFHSNLQMHNNIKLVQISFSWNDKIMNLYNDLSTYSAIMTLLFLSIATNNFFQY